MSVEPRDAAIGWPRVAAAFDFYKPLRFEDEIEVPVMFEKELTSGAIRTDLVLSADRRDPDVYEAASADGRVRFRRRRDGRLCPGAHSLQGARAAAVFFNAVTFHFYSCIGL